MSIEVSQTSAAPNGSTLRLDCLGIVVHVTCDNSGVFTSLCLLGCVLS